MRLVLRAMLLAFMALLVQAAVATGIQIRLTEKDVQGFISAQRDMAAAITETLKNSGGDEEVKARLDDAAKEHGFQNFAEYDQVAANILMVMAGIDPLTRKFTDPRATIEKEIAEVTADPSIPAEEKEELLEGLKEAAVPVEYPSNIDLVLKYYDDINALSH